MTRITTAVLLALPLQACIIYNANWDEEEWGDDWDSTVDEQGWEEDTAIDANPLALYLDPPAIGAGEMGIISLRSDAGADLSTVATVEFHGEVSVHALQARADEAVLSIGAGSETGLIDATITFEDGESYWLTEALDVYVVDDGGEDTGDPCP